MRDAFIAQLTALAESDPRLTLITGDLGFGVLDNFEKRFPRQYLNAGVAEQNMTGLAVGLALEGRIVFTYSIGNFPTLRCLEQIRSDAAYHGANVKIVAIGGGFSYGTLGMSHHATEDLAILRALPDVTVVSPGDDWEAAEATRALVQTAGTCYLRLDRSSAASTRRGDERFELGKGRVVAEGRDVVVVTCGSILSEVMRAAKMLEGSGVAPTIVSLHTIKPIDSELLVSLARSHTAMLTVEEHQLAGGLGSAVVEVLADSGAVPPRFRRLGIANQFVSEVGSQEYLRRRCGLDAETIAVTIRSLAG